MKIKFGLCVVLLMFGLNLTGCDKICEDLNIADPQKVEIRYIGVVDSIRKEVFDIDACGRSVYRNKVYMSNRRNFECDRDGSRHIEPGDTLDLKILTYKNDGNNRDKYYMKSMPTFDEECEIIIKKGE